MTLQRKKKVRPGLGPTSEERTKPSSSGLDDNILTGLLEPTSNQHVVAMGKLEITATPELAEPFFACIYLYDVRRQMRVSELFWFHWIDEKMLMRVTSSPGVMFLSLIGRLSGQ